MAWGFFDAAGRLKQSVVGPPVPMDIWHKVGDATTGLGTAFAGAWNHEGGGLQDVGFRKYPDGTVRIRGRAAGGAVGSYAFTLPVGYRPPVSTQEFVAFANNATGFMQVDANGGVYIFGGSDTVDRDLGCTFDTESVSQVSGGPAGQAPRVTALPTSPVHGQEVLFVADATNGVLWHLSYNALSASAYKWECVSGRSLYVRDNTDVNNSGGGYNTLGAVAITLPAVAGDFDIDWGGGCYIAGAGNIVRLGIKIGAAAADDTNCTLFEAPGTYTEALATSHRFLGIAASSVIILQVGGNSNGHATKRWMRITPVRVG